MTTAIKNNAETKVLIQELRKLRFDRKWLTEKLVELKDNKVLVKKNVEKLKLGVEANSESKELKRDLASARQELQWVNGKSKDLKADKALIKNRVKELKVV
ncbi:MAG: Cft2 family RNA processing exonuclease [Psychroserpens sp.]|jgi:Cft2 family RNA processing exonuclease